MSMKSNVIRLINDAKKIYAFAGIKTFVISKCTMICNLTMEANILESRPPNKRLKVKFDSTIAFAVLETPSARLFKPASITGSSYVGTCFSTTDSFFKKVWPSSAEK